MQLCHNQEICEALELMSLSTFQSGQKLSSEHNIRIKNLYFFRGKIIRKSTLHDLYISFYHTASLARHIRYLRKQVHKYYIIVFRTVWLSIISTKQNVSSNAFWQRHNKNVKACKNGHPNHLSDHCQDYLQKQFETLYNLKKRHWLPTVCPRPMCSAGEGGGCGWGEMMPRCQESQEPVCTPQQEAVSHEVSALSYRNIHINVWGCVLQSTL